MKFKDNTQMEPIDVVNKLVTLGLIDKKTALDNEFFKQIEALCKANAYDNWDHLQSKIQEELLDDGEEDDSDEYDRNNFRVFYHGTSSDVADKIIKEGIKLSKLGDGHGDFDGSGQAFYVTNDLEQAKDWPKRGEKKANRRVVKFTVNKDDLINLNDLTYSPNGGWKFYSNAAKNEFEYWLKDFKSRNGVVIEALASWEEQIRNGRAHTPKSDEMDIDYVEGPMCGTTGSIESAIKSLSPTGHQLAIRSKSAADVFNKGSRAIVRRRSK